MPQIMLAFPPRFCYHINVAIIRRSIEVVITGRTRNAFALTGTWVRIPPSPPFYGVFAKCKNLVFSLGTAKNSLGTHKFTTPARVLSDDTFEFASKWEYVFAVVEKSLCPSHT